jgi:transcriptional regulator with XRE-family HTH domain
MARIKNEHRLGATIGQNIKAARERVGLSREELAKACTMTPAQIFLIERGDSAPRLPTLVRVAGSLGLEPHELLGQIRWDPPSGKRHGRMILTEARGPTR